MGRSRGRDVDVAIIVAMVALAFGWAPHLAGLLELDARMVLPILLVLSLGLSWKLVAWRRLDTLQEAARLSSEASEERRVILASISHEIRTPLTILRGVTETMARPEMAPSQTAPLLEAQRRAVDELDTLLGRVLDASRSLEELRRLNPHEPLDLVEVCRRAAHRLPESGGRFRLSGQGRVVVSSISPLIELAVQALFDQQLKALPHTADLQVTIERHRREVRLHIGATLGPSEPRCNESHPDLSPTGGMGLNVLLADSLITQVGGRLWLHGHGTPQQSVQVVLPQRRQQDDQPPTRERARKP